MSTSTWWKRLAVLGAAFVVGCTAADWVDMLDDSSSSPGDESDLDNSSGGGYSGYGAVPPAPGYGNTDDLRYSQPRMSSALDHLQEAHSELEQADTNKGGYRKDAIDHVEAAIEAVQTGMQYDATH